MIKSMKKKFSGSEQCSSEVSFSIMRGMRTAKSGILSNEHSFVVSAFGFSWIHAQDGGQQSVLNKESCRFERLLRKEDPGLLFLLCQEETMTVPVFPCEAEILPWSSHRPDGQGHPYATFLCLRIYVQVDLSKDCHIVCKMKWLS